MKVPDNTLLALRNFFLSELKGIYDDGEALQLFKLAAESYLKLPFNRPMDQHLRISESEMLLFFYLIKRLRKFEPIQYALGEAYFCDLKLKVSPAVLIPRPETEELVYWVREDFKLANSIVDLCSGSGCIPLALKYHYKSAEVVGVEISEEAVDISQENAKTLRLDVKFEKKDVLKMTAHDLLNDIDVLTSNPPYIFPEEAISLHKNVLEFEPHLALFALDNGSFAFYEKIAELAMSNLRSGGRVYVEIHHLHATQVSELFSLAGLTEVTVKHDISDRPRMVRATRP